MDRKVEKDGVVYTHWNEMGWNPMYSKSSPLELRESFMNITKNTDRIYIYTDEGYRRQGVWSRTISNWTKGRCIVEFERVCDEGIKMYDLEAKDDGIQDLFDNDIVVQETDLVSIFLSSFVTYTYTYPGSRANIIYCPAFVVLSCSVELR